MCLVGLMVRCEEIIRQGNCHPPPLTFDPHPHPLLTVGTLLSSLLRVPFSGVAFWIETRETGSAVSTQSTLFVSTDSMPTIKLINCFMWLVRNDSTGGGGVRRSSTAECPGRPACTAPEKSDGFAASLFGRGSEFVEYFQACYAIDVKSLSNMADSAQQFFRHYPMSFAAARWTQPLHCPHKSMTDNQPLSVVYVLSNPAMPGLVKIGRTSQDDHLDRVSQLYTTGVPVPFEVEYACRVPNPVDVESALHRAFAPQRINPRREFFEIEPDQAIAILRLLNVEDVTEEVKLD